jgi:hypothetical protein
VRALVRLKRFPEAIRESEAIVEGNNVLPILAHAAAGDVRQTMAAVAKWDAAPYLLSACYRDDDLGPLLRSEPFREFRAKYPEPARTDGNDD